MDQNRANDSNSPDGQKIGRSVFGAGLLFVVLALVFFSRGLGKDFYFRDPFFEFYPLRLLFGFVRQGCFPLWNPYVGLGVPLSGAVYPVSNSAALLKIVIVPFSSTTSTASPELSMIKLR